MERGGEKLRELVKKQNTSSAINWQGSSTRLAT